MILRNIGPDISSEEAVEKLAGVGVILHASYLELLTRYGNGGTLAHDVWLPIERSPHSDKECARYLLGVGHPAGLLDLYSTLEGMMFDHQLRMDLFPFMGASMGFFCIERHPLRAGQISFWCPQVEHGDLSYFCAPDMRSFCDMIDQKEQAILRGEVESVDESTEPVTPMEKLKAFFGW